jgi:hypothetical protein
MVNDVYNSRQMDWSLRRLDIEVVVLSGTLLLSVEASLELDMWV